MPHIHDVKAEENRSPQSVIWKGKMEIIGNEYGQRHVMLYTHCSDEAQHHIQRKSTNNENDKLFLNIIREMQK